MLDVEKQCRDAFECHVRGVLNLDRSCTTDEYFNSTTHYDYKMWRTAWMLSRYAMIEELDAKAEYEQERRYG